jgi:hypothetical protein
MHAEGPERDDLSPVLVSLLKLSFGFGALIALATGIWMVAAPEGWFEVFPGSIADTGPLNVHFVRDLGGWYLALGVLLLFALTNPMRFGGVALVVSGIGLGSHAFIHVSDVISGRLPPEHWVIDAPLVFAPFLVVGVLTWVWWSLQRQRHQDLFGDGESEEEIEDRTAVFNDF